MANELKHPANDEQSQRPSPFEEEQRPRDRNHRDADDMTELVQRMLVLGFVIVDEGIGHDSFNLTSSCFDLPFYVAECSQTSMKISIVPPQTMPSSLASSAVNAK